MGGGAGIVLAICGGGGNNTVATIIFLFVVALWVLALGAVLRGAEDAPERRSLLVLLCVSIVLGAAIFLAPGGASGIGGYLARVLVSLLVSAALAGAVAVATGRLSVGRGLAIAFIGNVLVPGGIFLLLFTSFGIGSGCLD